MFSCSNEGSHQADTFDKQAPFYKYQERAEARWVSFENPTGKKGQGGKENKGAKGHPCDVIEAGKSVTLLDFNGTGIISRMWFTINFVH